MSGIREDLTGAPLGEATAYPDAYDARLLFPVQRAPQREEIGLAVNLPFTGDDLWTAFELTWLDIHGKPQVAIATFIVPANSPAIVESKSVKLYLGAFAQTRFDDAAEVRATIERDLSHAAGAPVQVELTVPGKYRSARDAELAGESLDDLPVLVQRYQLAPELLAAEGPMTEEVLKTDLFRSLCPITFQPDFASVQVAYRGPAIDHAALLRYLVSYRCHPGFHEHCVERIFVDLVVHCRCETLSVYARFTRRGGVDINPFRTNAGIAAPRGVRTARQ
ncbi:MAG: NADPH-dependent 7-cyano-7-deazaguanine reductase QueF [Betaproteobacteria bacterium]